MKLKFGEQISFDDLVHTDNIDLVVYASNHEIRSKYFVNKITSIKETTSLIKLCYKQKKGYSSNEHFISSNDVLIEILDNYFTSLCSNKSTINIIVDYSCMTKSWYYLILQYILNKEVDIVKNLNLFFVYTPAYFSKPKSPKHNSEIGPLPGKLIIPNNKPNALIVCLGYEENQAEGIIGHLDPNVYFLFYSKPSLDPKFVECLETNNANLLKSTDNVITFQFDNLLYIERELTYLYDYLKNDYNIIIAPLGPKPFTLVAMLLSIKYPDIDIWRVGSGGNINEYKQKPIEDNEIIMKVVFSK